MNILKVNHISALRYYWNVSIPDQLVHHALPTLGYVVEKRNPFL